MPLHDFVCLALVPAQAGRQGQAGAQRRRQSPLVHENLSEEEVLTEIGAHSPSFVAFQHTDSVILNQPFGVFVKSCGSQQETEIIAAILNKKRLIP